MFFRALYLIILFTFSCLSLSNASQRIELDCKHISPLQSAYLARHITATGKTGSLESRVKDQFIKKLDPTKLYFLEGDITKIKRKFSNLFAQISSGDCSSIKEAHERLVKRVEGRTEEIKNYLGKKTLKLKKKTKLALDPSKRLFYKTKKSSLGFHKKYLQFQIANQMANDIPLSEAKENVSKSYDRLKKKLKNMKDIELWSMYLDAFAQSLDPHSSYLSQEELEDFEISMRLSLEGIGATLSFINGFTVIEQLIPGGPAYLSNRLQSKDKIVAIGQGDRGKIVDVVGVELRDVVKKIRGKKGTKVRLSILRKKAKKTERFTVTIVRDKIKIENGAATINYIEKNIKGVKTLVGVVYLPSFYADSRRGGRSSAKDLKKILAEAKKKRVQGIVLDLSQNGGGSLNDAVEIAGLFFKKGNVVKQSTRGSYKLLLEDKDPTVDYSGPLVILTSKASASGSEIVAGALADYKRAVIVGGKSTFGKGSVQSVEQLPVGLGAMKTTVGMFFTSGGYSTQKRGVKADVVLPSSYIETDIGESSLDYALPPKKIESFLSQEAYVNSGKDMWKKISSSTIAKLKEKSQRRVKKNKEFTKIIQDKKKAIARGKVFLVSEIFETKSDDDDKEENKDKKGVVSKAKERARYLKRLEIRESINVLVDLIHERKQRQKGYSGKRAG